MGAPDILASLAARGLHLSRDGAGIRVTPRSALTDEARRLILAHKAELLATLRESADFGSAASGTKVEAMPGRAQPSDADQGDALPDPAAEARRQRVLAMFAERPDIQRAVYCDGIPVNGIVTIAVGVRYAGGIATADIEVQADRYDGMQLLDLIARHGATVH